MLTCLSCRGARKVSGMGFMETDCSACEGTGLAKPIEPVECAKSEASTETFTPIKEVSKKRHAKR